MIWFPFDESKDLAIKQSIRTKPQPKLLWWSRGSLDLFNEQWSKLEFYGPLIFSFQGGFATSQEHQNEKSWKPCNVSCNHTTLSDVCLMRLEFSQVQEKLGWSQILWHGKDVMMKGSLHEEDLWKVFWKMMQQNLIDQLILVWGLKKPL